MVFMSSSSPIVFDRSLARRHIERASRHFKDHNILFEECASQLNERLSEVTRDFPIILDLSPFPFLSGKTGNTFVVSSHTVAIDEELLPFASESFDLIASNLALHWVNDVPGTLSQIKSILKPEGLFMASLIGGQTLFELRSCLLDAELAITGGASPRLSPTIDLQTASALMQRAGFTLPVVDKESVTLVYENIFALMHELRGMGQANAHIQRLRVPTKRAVFLEAARLYQERFGTTEGHITATFDIIYLHGWK
jgi:NADH dehydrogenase [ubiquinone] 1 alpha subcomplex assembly factor 5